MKINNIKLNNLNYRANYRKNRQNNNTSFNNDKNSLLSIEAAAAKKNLALAGTILALGLNTAACSNQNTSTLQNDFQAIYEEAQDDYLKADEYLTKADQYRQNAYEQSKEVNEILQEAKKTQFKEQTDEYGNITRAFLLTQNNAGDKIILINDYDINNELKRLISVAKEGYIIDILDSEKPMEYIISDVDTGIMKIYENVKNPLNSDREDGFSADNYYRYEFGTFAYAAQNIDMSDITQEMNYNKKFIFENDQINGIIKNGKETKESEYFEEFSMYQDGECAVIVKDGFIDSNKNLQYKDSILYDKGVAIGATIGDNTYKIDSKGQLKKAK